MQTMAATPIDVAREFAVRISGLPLTFAYMLYDGPRKTILFTTFLQSIDDKAEDALAQVEAYMTDAFSEYLLDFKTIHLMGRDFSDFMPDGAVPLLPTPGSALHRATHK